MPIVGQEGICVNLTHAMTKAIYSKQIILIGLVVLVGAIVLFNRLAVPMEKTIVQPSISPEASADAYYGHATSAACQTDADCIVSGCNSEICQGKSEEPLMSICVIPNQPTPKDLGYVCSCTVGACQWNK